VPYINKELGTINNIKEIYEICKTKNILLSSNINQLFGYTENYKLLNSIDISFTSFETIYGPANLSLLIVKKNLLNDNIYSLIKSSNYSISNTGANNEKKNLPYISGSLCSIISTMKNRNDKNDKILQLKNIFINKLNDILPTYDYYEYNKIYKQSIIKLSIVFLNNNTPGLNKSNTILFSIYSNKIKINSNHIKKYLLDNDIIINDVSTFIINIMDYDTRIKNGLISLSIDDHNKQTDINKLLKCLLESIKLQYNDLYDEIKDNIIVKKKLSQKKVKKVVRFSNPICIGSNTKKHNHLKLKSILV